MSYMLKTSLTLSIHQIEVTKEVVLKMLIRFKENKAVGPGNIH